MHSRRYIAALLQIITFCCLLCFRCDSLSFSFMLFSNLAGFPQFYPPASVCYLLKRQVFTIQAQLLTLIHFDTFSAFEEWNLKDIEIICVCMCFYHSSMWRKHVWRRREEASSLYSRSMAHPRHHGLLPAGGQYPAGQSTHRCFQVSSLISHQSLPLVILPCHAPKWNCSDLMPKALRFYNS